jgi:hypothetical protein
MKDKIKLVCLIAFGIALFSACIFGTFWAAEKVSEALAITFSQLPR